MKPHPSPFINRRQKTIEFYIENDCAHHISLAGTFNHWARDLNMMHCDKEGCWKISIPLLPSGEYRYKFIIDDRMDVEVLISSEDRDNFVKNMLTVRAEERLALAVKRPAALVTGEFNEA